MAEDEFRIQGAFQCAPVLAKIKASNLLTLEKEDTWQLVRIMENTQLSCEYLYTITKRSVWLVFWKDELEKILSSRANRRFLRSLGYREFTLAAVLNRLKQRCRAHHEGRISYPHELGIILGYPLADVEGFINHKGQNYLCSGYWKVYENAEGARRLFALYNQARNQAASLARAGLGFQELIQVLELQMLLSENCENQTIPGSVSA
ncbi:MAG: DUF3793 family protein [Lachnospiraceae bacterium]|nr:DUF3793 family protein [Lachnospiraceae bacterium]